MIDAHHHLWSLARPECHWPTEAEGPIHRDFAADDFRAVAEPAGITGSVLVQSQENGADTEWLLRIAQGEPMIAAVVGWIDLAAPDAAAGVAALAARPKLRGLRPMVQDKASGWYDAPGLDAGLAAMAEAGLRLDGLVRARHLPALERLARRHPGLGIVIDHAGKPNIGDPAGFSRWREAIAPLADRPNICCKLSGLLTEAPPARRRKEAIAPYVEALLGLFGPDRLIWGSDWPVLDLAGDYRSWLDLALALVPERDRRAVFDGNARGFYRLGIGGEG